MKKEIIKKRLRVFLIFFLFYIVAIFLFLEISSRIFLKKKYQASFFRPAEAIYKFYPELKIAKDTKIYEKDISYDILFLGESTLNKHYGNIEEILLNKLKNNIRRKIRIFNLAMPTHSSLDSYYKYKYLEDRHFDLVLLYDGINEVRANNCPLAVFKKDYSHYSWYEDIKIFHLHKEINFLALPYMLHAAVIKIWQKFNHSRYVPGDAPRAEWLRYGCEVKTKESFKRNLAEILEIASKKNETVVLMTFAFYVPRDYSLEKFENNLLDYARHRWSVEIWGSPDCVVKGITAHNEVIREISHYYHNTIFMDQNNLIPKNSLYFDDICHLSEKGCEKFVDVLLERSIMPDTDFVVANISL